MTTLQEYNGKADEALEAIVREDPRRFGLCRKAVELSRELDVSEFWEKEKDAPIS